MIQEELLTTDEAAAFLRYNPETLRAMRIGSSGPPCYKVGEGQAGKVLYRRSELLEWATRNPIVPPEARNGANAD